MAKRNLLKSHLKPNASKHGDFRPWKGNQTEKTYTEKSRTYRDKKQIKFIIDTNKDIKEQCLSYVRRMKWRGFYNSEIIAIIERELKKTKKPNNYLCMCFSCLWTDKTYGIVDKCPNCGSEEIMGKPLKEIK